MKNKKYISAKGARSAGVLCHISSLPGKYGIGTLGKAAYDFVDLLDKTGVRYWQILPIVQTGFGDSPYQSVCANSGNPYFIDLDTLKEEGLLTEADLKQAEMQENAETVDYGKVYNTRYPVLRKAFSSFDKKDKAFKSFLKQGKFSSYAEYMTLKGLQSNRCFIDWDDCYKLNDRSAVSQAMEENKEEYLFWQWLQFEFFKQWNALKDYANEREVFLIGDLPLYMAYDSADVWSMPEMFKLDEDRKLTEVAGVPPDYFCEDGQLWGNPLYNWEAQKKDGYSWWINRLKDALTTFDVVRVDHFRGLDRYYAIPADAVNARIGEWQHGPKAELFELAKQKIGKLNIIAEDLGVLDDGVYKLLNDTAFPGMKILLFAFEGGDNDYLPKNIQRNSITYTGTHDNDTVVGYLDRISPEMKEFVVGNIRAALKSRGIRHSLKTDEDIRKAFLYMLFECDSLLSIVPVQDILGLDNTARMNTPATSMVNWKFRLKELPTKEELSLVKKLLKKYNRLK